MMVRMASRQETLRCCEWILMITYSEMLWTGMNDHLLGDVCLFVLFPSTNILSGCQWPVVELAMSTSHGHRDMIKSQSVCRPWWLVILQEMSGDTKECCVMAGVTTYSQMSIFTGVSQNIVESAVPSCSTSWYRHPPTRVCRINSEAFFREQIWGWGQASSS